MKLTKLHKFIGAMLIIGFAFIVVAVLGFNDCISDSILKSKWINEDCLITEYICARTYVCSLN